MSNLTTVAGNALREDIMNGIPNNDTTLKWPKRRQPTIANLNLWQKLTINTFAAAHRIYPTNLGYFFLPQVKKEQSITSINLYIKSYPKYYTSLLGGLQLTDIECKKNYQWLIKGELYGGSDGSELNELGAHAFGFTHEKSF